MRYLDSLQDFFKSPRWVTNILLAGLCVLIPIVGPIALIGWLLTGFWARRDEDPATFPDLDFSRFGDYLQRGVWPFLVMLVSAGVLAPVLWILIMIPTVLLSFLLQGNDSPGLGNLIAIAFGLVMFVFYIVAIVAVVLVTKPLVLKASLTQDFAKAFDFNFVKRFISLMWKESILSALFLSLVSFVLMPLGMLAFCVGVYAAAALIYYAWAHLDKQIYALYLGRGGEPVEISPKLSEPPQLSQGQPLG